MQSATRCMLCSVFACGAATTAGAATLTASHDTEPPSPTVLTQPNAFDWAIWDHTSGTRSGAPTNRMSGGDGSIGNASAITNNSITGTLRGVGGSITVTYTDGTSPTAETKAIGALANSVLDDVGRGYRLEITGDVNTERTVYVYVGGYAAEGTFSASLAGSPTYVADPISYPVSAPKDRDLYILNFRPDNPADKLIISQILSTDVTSTANSHVLLSAVVVTPEPASIGLLGAGVAGLLLSRRRPTVPARKRS